jgi:CDP-glucose 4,6-dehydratase
VGIGGCAVAGVEVEPAFWRGRRVLLTGHTGFKGGWLSLWLQALGADCVGLSIDVPTEPSLYRLARLDESMEWITADVRDFEAVRVAVERTRPEIVVHMAAQSLVRRSFVDPRETYETNVMGTVNVLEAVRAQGDVRVVVNVTSDKCYENREWEWGYREDEPMGGHDPYSNSKGCAELVTSAYRRSFFESGETRIASARAGNVIGGGDWGEDRLIPDLMRAVLAGETLRVRNPGRRAPLAARAQSAERLPAARAGALGWLRRWRADGTSAPSDDDAQRVSWIVERVAERWPGGVRSEPDPRPAPHEAQQLKLDSSRARARLGWRPRWDLATGIDAVVEWYSAYADSSDAREITLAQIERFLAARGA